MIQIKYLFPPTLLMIVLLAWSCTKSSTNKSIEVFQYNDTVQTIPSPKSKHELPSVLAYGKIIPPEFPDSMKIERNLLSQVASYNSALLHGDVETCKKYLYPDAFEYCKKFYTGFPDEDVINEFFKGTSGDMQEALLKWQEMGVDFNIVVLVDDNF